MSSSILTNNLTDDADDDASSVEMQLFRHGFVSFDIIFDDPVVDYIPERLLMHLKPHFTAKSIAEKHESAARRHRQLLHNKKAYMAAKLAHHAQVVHTQKMRQVATINRIKQRLECDMKYHMEKRFILLEIRSTKSKLYQERIAKRVEMIKYKRYLEYMAEMHKRRRAESLQRALELCNRATNEGVGNQLSTAETLVGQRVQQRELQFLEQERIRIRNIYIDDDDDDEQNNNDNGVHGQ